MKKTIQFLALLLFVAAFSSLASCTKDNSGSGNGKYSKLIVGLWIPTYCYDTIYEGGEIINDEVVNYERKTTRKTDNPNEPLEFRKNGTFLWGGILSEYAAYYIHDNILRQGFKHANEWIEYDDYVIEELTDKTLAFYEIYKDDPEPGLFLKITWVYIKK